MFYPNFYGKLIMSNFINSFILLPFSFSFYLPFLLLFLTFFHSFCLSTNLPYPSNIWCFMHKNEHFSSLNISFLAKTLSFLPGAIWKWITIVVSFPIKSLKSFKKSSQDMWAKVYWNHDAFEWIYFSDACVFWWLLHWNLLNKISAWMNNCIGFYNHRYFIMFCVFMWLGTLYVCFTSFDLFMYHFFHPGVSIPFFRCVLYYDTGHPLTSQCLPW